MNLFVLDEDPELAARQNCDVHNTKIILEAAQCMCAAHWEHGFKLIDSAPFPLRIGKYRAASHRNNHVTKWVRASTANYEWTYKHALALCEEYSHRYNIRTGNNRRHATEVIVQWLADNIPADLPDEGQHPFRLAMPVECYHEDAVVAYWTYYVCYKSQLARWKWTETPFWYTALSKLRDAGKTLDYIKSEASAMRQEVLV